MTYKNEQNICFPRPRYKILLSCQVALIIAAYLLPIIGHDAAGSKIKDEFWLNGIELVNLFPVSGLLFILPLLNVITYVRCLSLEKRIDRYMLHAFLYATCGVFTLVYAYKYLSAEGYYPVSVFKGAWGIPVFYYLNIFFMVCNDLLEWFIWKEGISDDDLN